MNLTIAGESIHLLPDRALFWPRERALFIADLHLGKANHFQSHGLPVPNPAAHDLERLATLVSQTGTTHLYLLGDLFHAPTGNTHSLFSLLHAFFDNHPNLTTTLIRGNHDPLPAKLPTSLPLTIHAPLSLDPFLLSHAPPQPRTLNPEPPSTPHTLCGHLHPAITLRPGKSSRSLRAPCFHLTPTHTVLPAFGSFTGTHPVSPSPGDRIFATADNTLTEVPEPLWAHTK